MALEDDKTKLKQSLECILQKWGPVEGKANTIDEENRAFTATTETSSSEKRNWASKCCNTTTTTTKLFKTPTYHLSRIIKTIGFGKRGRM